MRRPKYRLSPNEVERLVKEDQEQRRKLRIIQVREQSKANAAIIRNDVRREKERLINHFAATLKVQLEAEKEEDIRKCEHKYEKTLRAIGEGHKEALIHGDGENRAEKLQKQMEDEAAAQERFKQALDRQRQEDSVKEFERTKHVLARQAALLTEKQRAMEIASLPPPPPDISVELETNKKRAIPMLDMQAFATTHFHIPDYHVVRAGSQEQLYDAKAQAQDSDLKLKQDLEDKARAEHAQLERARIRGNEALQKELLKHDYEDMLKDLSLLQRKDRRMRKKMLSQIPKQVFIPPEIYLEEKKEKQYEMERKFNEIYMDHLKMERDKQRQVDVSDQIVSHEFEAVSSPQTTAAAAEDFSISMSRINPALRDLTNQPPSGADSEVKKPDTVLKQLLNRIKEQRDDSGTSQHIPVASEAVPSVLATIPAKRRLESAEGNQNRTVAAVNKATWVTTQDGSPVLGPGATSLTRRSRGQPTGDFNLQPEVGVQALSENEKMIEDLRRRIELIQSQKEDLAQQLKAQVGGLPLLTDTEGSSLEADEEGWTLEEVDIDPGSRIDQPNQGSEQVNIAPVGDGSASHVGTATSAWQPPLGTGWGSAVGSHLITDVGSDFTFEATGDVRIQQQRNDMPVGRLGLDIGAAKSSWRPLKSWDNLGGTRTDLGSGTRMETRVQPEGGLLQGYGLSEMMKLSGVDISSAGANSRQMWPNPVSFDRVTASSLGYGTMGSLTDESTSQGQGHFVGRGHGGAGSTGHSVRSVDDNADLMRKVQEYRARAVERQANMDAETLGQVREYQRQLLRTYEEKKKYLADIRADIDKRQQELSTAASSKPAFSLESIQISQSVASGSGKHVPYSQTVSAGGKLVPSGSYDSKISGRRNDGGKNVQMFETRKTSVATSVSGPTTLSAQTSALIKDKQNGGSGAENMSCKVTSELHGQEEVISACHRGSSGGKFATDNVRKSLSFDEEFMKSGNVSWNDVTDADNSKCSQALTEDSRLMSSEEERGSPVLPQGHFELSDKLDTLPQDNAYLCGSALLAQAQERKLGFEHRQMELQNQLLDIQRQKDAIMQAFYTGQTALQQREKTLVSKMATASALLNEDSSGKQREEVRAKLACIRSQIDTDTRSRTMPQESRSAHFPIDFDHSKESRLNAAVSNSNCNMPPHPTEHLSDSTDMDRTSSRQSLGNCSMPANISSDSYLAEISFHKIRSDDGRSLPSSAFHVPVPSSASSILVSKGVSVGHQQAPQTWASILSTSVDCQQQAVGWQQQHSLQDGGPVGQNERNRASLSNTGLTVQQSTVVSHQDDFQNARSLAADVADHFNSDLVEDQYTSSPMAYGLTDHQPHELSTILEVETPGSVSAMTSCRKIVTLSEQPTANSDPVNSIPSSGWSLHRVNPDVRMDVFADLPYTFQENRTGSLGAGAVYHLQSGLQYQDTSAERSGPGLRLDTSTPGAHKQTTAKRSLDFSDSLYVSNMPSLVGLTQYSLSDRQVQEVEGSEQGHFDNDRTLGQCGSASEDSSLRISGFSDYMRLQEMSLGKTDDDCTGTSVVPATLSNIDVGSCTAPEDKQTVRPEVLSSLPLVPSFDANIVERLQQQSRAVFDDVVGEGSETSAVSLFCSSLSCDLEEVSISETGS